MSVKKSPYIGIAWKIGSWIGKKLDKKYDISSAFAGKLHEWRYPNDPRSNPGFTFRRPGSNSYAVNKEPITKEEFEESFPEMFSDQ